MKPRELQNLGIPRGPATKAAQLACGAASLDRTALRARVIAVVAAPADHIADAVWGPLARALLATPADAVTRDAPAPSRVWGTQGQDFDNEAVAQLRSACTLPIAVAGALMPDAHVGYGLPIGGVLATKGAVIPYAVGVDIACRMKMTVLDLPASTLDTDAGRERLTRAIEAETRFGVGAEFGRGNDRTTAPRDHAVMDHDWSVSPITARNKDKAHRQLGTSGSGNHFVEFGTLTVDDAEHARALRLDTGVHLALLSHSGSRGTGAAVCDHYSRIAMALHPDLPPQLRYLAWLDLDSDDGRAYWDAMTLMGAYAAANHDCIHRHIAKHLGARVAADIENHHNFAWIERHDIGDGAGQQELVVHRKGATPAGAGVLGIIPGSMAQPGFVVRGRGSAPSLHSASHGAGRVMSRTKARSQFRWNAIKPMLRERGVTLISAGIDENPMVYKDIHRVMALQRDLVETLARFDPRLVKMAPEGEKAED
jgi:tRNA-splicing ligase RtcB